MKKHKLQLNEIWSYYPYKFFNLLEDPQNPGLGGIDELTLAEEIVVQAITAGTYFVSNQELSGTIDGVNSTFTSPTAPNPTNSAKLYYNGQRLTYGTDFTVSGTIWTVLIDGVLPPEAGKLVSDYTVSPV